MEELRRCLEALPLCAEDCEEIAKLLAVVRMTEEMREMTAELKEIIAAHVIADPCARNTLD